MPCVRPLKGFRSSKGGGVTFSPKDGYTDLEVSVPCGQCIACKVDRSKEWAVRCMHELQARGGKGMFLTLTYSDEYLPALGSLVPKHLQDFIKRLRKHFSPERLSFYACGEYGDKGGRPHYHVCVFGVEFSDGVVLPRARSKARLFRSPTLEQLWSFGNSSYGEVTFQSAGYVARYALKKRTGAMAVVYDVVSPDTGEVLGRRVPEFSRMSRRPAIGLRWFERFRSDLYPSDFVATRTGKVRVPRYYDKLLRRSSPEVLEGLKEKRVKSLLKHPGENSPGRLGAKEAVALAKSRLFSRSVEI